MKHFFSSLLCLATFTGLAQEPAPGRMDMLLPEQLDQTHRSVFWLEDFANGIPSSWSQEGEANWEYRGPGTDPNIEAGTQGACIAEGLIWGAPIDSETRENGFVIFDSDHWDSVGPCGNFGSGPVPGPHDCSLITSSIDLSTHPFCGIKFTQYARHYNASFRVEVSANGGPWVEVYEPGLGFNQETERDAVAQVNISAQAGGASDVRIRFRFDGLYYFWMIDDIELFDLEEDDLFLFDPMYGDFDINAPDHPTGYEYMEYTQMPVEMVQQLKISASIENRGGAIQTNTRLNAEVYRLTGGETLLYQQESEAFALNPGQTEEFRSGDFTPNTEVGTYQVRYEALSDNTEDVPDDNEGERTFYISPVTLARDGLALDAVYIPIPGMDDLAYELGSVFLVDQPGLQCHSLTAGVSVGSQVGSTIYGKLYLYDFNNGVAAQLIGESAPVEITSSDTNNAGQNKVIVLPFDSPVPLTNGQAYIAVVGAEGGAVQMLCGMSGEADAFTSWVHFLIDDSWFFLSRIPMVRMNFGPYTVNVEESSKADLGIWPNPVVDHLNVQLDQPAILNCLDLSGRLIMEKRMIPGTNIVDCTDLPAGSYLMTLQDLNGYLIGRKVVIRQ